MRNFTDLSCVVVELPCLSIFRSMTSWCPLWLLFFLRHAFTSWHWFLSLLLLQARLCLSSGLVFGHNDHRPRTFKTSSSDIICQEFQLLYVALPSCWSGWPWSPNQRLYLLAWQVVQIYHRPLLETVRPDSWLVWFPLIYEGIFGTSSLSHYGGFYTRIKYWMISTLQLSKVQMLPPKCIKCNDFQWQR